MGDGSDHRILVIAHIQVAPHMCFDLTLTTAKATYNAEGKQLPRLQIKTSTGIEVAKAEG
jgi:hypothetical protein